MKKRVLGMDMIIVQILAMVLCLALTLPAFALGENGAEVLVDADLQMQSAQADDQNVPDAAETAEGVEAGQEAGSEIVTGLAFAAGTVDGSGVTSEDGSEAAKEVAEAILDDGGKAGESRAFAVSTGQVFTAKSINKSGGNDPITTPEVTEFTEYEFGIRMPAQGTLMITYAASDSAGAYVRCANMTSSATFDTTVNGVKCRSQLYYISSAKTVKAIASVYKPSSTSSNYAAISLVYYPTAKSARAATSKKKTFGMCTTGDSSKYRTFKIKSPGKGYLRLAVASASGSGTVKLKGPGFKGYEYLTSNNNTIIIGVKKGTYTFRVKSSSTALGVAYQYKKVKESKYGSKKGNAAALKKKSSRKGVMVTNSKKAHWYKIKNPKKQYVKLYINAKKINGGGNSVGGLKVTIYYPDGQNRVVYAYAGQYGDIEIIRDTPGGKKCMKGTYRIKVSSYKGGNGYFTLKWK